MARIESATVTPRSFELPPGFDTDKLLADTFGRFACAKRSHEVRVLRPKALRETIQTEIRRMAAQG
jgi:hypothetical protein